MLFPLTFVLIPTVGPPKPTVTFPPLPVSPTFELTPPPTPTFVFSPTFVLTPLPKFVFNPTFVFPPKPTFTPVLRLLL